MAVVWSVAYVFLSVVTRVYSYTDITSSVFGLDNNGIIAAFGDYNSDKLTDLFILSPNLKSVELLLATGSKTSFEKSNVNCTIKDGFISNIVPGDFDGDSVMDAVITAKTSNSYLDVYVMWGSSKMGVQCNRLQTLKITHEPLIFDYNYDRIPDILSVNATSGNRTVWTFDKNRNLNETLAFQNKPVQEMAHPNSNSFVDLNGDMIADVLITGKDHMEMWISAREQGATNDFTDPPGKRHYPNTTAVKGQSLFVDIDSTGELQHVLPVCYDSDCFHSAIMVYRSFRWVNWFDNFNETNTTWGFFSHKSQNLTLPIRLRAADIDMDGYPEFLMIVEKKSGAEKKTVSQVLILKNMPCQSCDFGRKLAPLSGIKSLGNFNSVYLATFFDIDDDGQMDILLVDNSNNKLTMHALQNDFNDDACFIKVLVISGLCYANCPGDHIAYGINQPGPFVKYLITKSNGAHQESCSSQLYQSAHFSLQLPYSVLGIGQSPNFVDKLTVAMPGNQSHEWTQIIPNSQMVVIPHPINSPDQWVNKLFVTPSRQVFLTFIALAGTCIGISLIIAFFHWLEKKEDRREKLQEAHRFHFDAM